MTPSGYQRFDKDDVRFAIRANPRSLFDRLGIRVRKSGGQLEACWCPARGEHSRRAMTFHPVKLVWHCHACGVGGDIFDLIQQAERLDFAEGIARLADLMNVPPSDANDIERERLRAEWVRLAADAKRREDERAAQLRATEHDRSLRYWTALQADHAGGAEYLAGRRLGDARALVRYDLRVDGGPAMPLYASDGRIKNVIRRRPVAGEKPIGLYGCSTAGTLVNSINQIVLQGADVVIAEGFADALTAKLAWRDAYVLGAAGAANIVKVAQLAAPRAASLCGRLLIAPHRDRDGINFARQACALATRAGLSRTRGSLELVDTGAQDLNDAWREGWTPR